LKAYALKRETVSGKCQTTCINSFRSTFNNLSLIKSAPFQARAWNLRLRYTSFESR